MSDSSATMTEREALARRFFEDGFNEGRVEALDEVMSDDLVLHDPQAPARAARHGRPARRGRDVPRRVPGPPHDDRGRHRAARPRRHPLDRTGHAHAGAQRPRARPIGTVKVTGITIQRIAGGRVAEAWTNWDTLGLLQQIGAAPAPGGIAEKVERPGPSRSDARGEEGPLRAERRLARPAIGSLGSPNTGRCGRISTTDADEGARTHGTDAGRRERAHASPSSPRARARRTSISSSRWRQEFGAVDGDAVRERLDDDSRALFGLGELSPLARADRLAAVMDRELGLAAEDTAGPVGLHFDEVVGRRCGHPAMLAAIGAELALRAGVAAGVYASPRRWFIGVGRRRGPRRPRRTAGRGQHGAAARGPRRLRARARVLRALRAVQRLHAAGPRRRRAPRRAPAPRPCPSSRAETALRPPSRRRPALRAAASARSRWRSADGSRVASSRPDSVSATLRLVRVEQHDADLLLQPPDPPAQRGLRRPELLRRAAEVHRPGEHVEAVEVAQVDHGRRSSQILQRKLSDHAIDRNAARDVASAVAGTRTRRERGWNRDRRRGRVGPAPRVCTCGRTTCL